MAMRYNTNIVKKVKDKSITKLEIKVNSIQRQK